MPALRASHIAGETDSLCVFQGLRQYADDKDFHKKWAAVKHANKERLAEKVLATTGVELDTSAMFDIQVILRLAVPLIAALIF